MIQPLVKAIMAEAALILSLCFETPMRKPLIRILDGLKSREGIVAGRIAQGGVVALWMFSVYSILKIHRRSIAAGEFGSTDQVILAEKLFEASLSGGVLFLSMVINRLYILIRDQDLLDKITENESQKLLERETKISERLIHIRKQIAELEATIKNLESKCNKKAIETEAAKATITALQKINNDSYVQYDRLLEYNQDLRNQLQSIDEQTLQKDDDQQTVRRDFKSFAGFDGVVQFLGLDTPEIGGEEIVVERSGRSWCREDLFSDSNSDTASVARHRRPIYQQYLL